MEVVSQIALPRERQAARPAIAVKTDHLDELTALLGRAFLADPLLQFLEPDSGWRAKLAPTLYRAVLRYCQRFGQADMTTDGKAVACWLLPSHCWPSLAREMRSGMWRLPFKARTTTLRRLLQFDAAAKRLRKQHAPMPHWYLWTIAVEPTLQRTGHATALLKPVLARADRGRETCYLETQNALNVPIYERFGFRLQATETLAGGLTIHAMRRDPQAAVQTVAKRANG